ncbi:hypothetical protein LXM94_23775 [Rhizobium sp. TRM95111]|uniref:hypothetical protein n=1 Tax=Rhizobium alarense TaxID=2846851 RepID=UPI001F19FD96|nr:hypothetical protein [Rhizobium alarense]MCF3642987.1 hypothetical protein [Rhizobium alarense]
MSGTMYSLFDALPDEDDAPPAAPPRRSRPEDFPLPNVGPIDERNDRITARAVWLLTALEACPICGADLQTTETAENGVRPESHLPILWRNDVAAVRFRCGLLLGVWNCGGAAHGCCQAASSAAMLALWDNANVEVAV